MMPSSLRFVSRLRQCTSPILFARNHLPKRFRSMTPFPCPVSTYRNKTYSAINPDGKASGKVIIITGASGGIGGDIALSFAKAGAKKLVLLGRDHAKLEQTRDNCRENGTEGAILNIYAADILDELALRKIAEETGPWDVLVCSAGGALAPGPIGTNISEWWNVMQTNVKGTLTTVTAFLPHTNTSHTTRPTIINVTAGSILVDVQRPPASLSSAYNASKIATIKLIEHLAAERPDLVAINVHPGIIPTATFNLVRTSPPTAGDIAAARAAGYVDEPGLAGDFAVWLSGPDAEWLSGKMVWANWDVDELVERKEEFSKGGWGGLTVAGWPFNRLE